MANNGIIKGNASSQDSRLFTKSNCERIASDICKSFSTLGIPMNNHGLACTCEAKGNMLADGGMVSSVAKRIQVWANQPKHRNGHNGNALDATQPIESVAFYIGDSVPNAEKLIDALSTFPIIGLHGTGALAHGNVKHYDKTHQTRISVGIAVLRDALYNVATVAIESRDETVEATQNESVTA